jgi:1-aminocyclopropane-1-carboxylate deaminase
VKPVAPEYKTLENIQITHLLSATHAPNDSDKDEVIKPCQDQGEVPYWIPSGASTHPLGGLGYARFAFEVAAQEQEMGIYFDTIILPCASGSTIGGMIAGFKLLSKSGDSKPRSLIGIDAFASTPGKSKSGILEIAKTMASKIGLQESDINEEDVVIDERWNAGSYGVVDDKTEAAIKFVARLEGILTDPVYTGKAVAGLIGKARLGELESSQNVLFVHTGGVLSLSAYPDLR